MKDVLNMLADANPFGAPDGGQILLWLACLWAVVKMVSEGSSLWGRFTGKEPLGRIGNPMHTRNDERLPTWAEWAALEKRVEIVEHELKMVVEKTGEDYRNLVEAGEKRAGRIMHALNESAGKQHARIDQILSAVSRLEGRVESSR